MKMQEVMKHHKDLGFYIESINDSLVIARFISNKNVHYISYLLCEYGLMHTPMTNFKEGRISLIFNNDGRDYQKLISNCLDNYTPKYMEYTTTDRGFVVPSNYAKRMYIIDKLLEYENERLGRVI